MNEGYPLTDFSLEELSLLSEALEQSIQQRNQAIKDFKSYFPNHAARWNVDNDKVRDMLVRSKTAFSIVQEREKVTQS